MSEGKQEGKETPSAPASAPSEEQVVQMMLGAIESKFQMMSEAILGRSEWKKQRFVDTRG